MSKAEIAESLEDINKKLNMLVMKQCGKRNAQVSDDDDEEEEQKGKKPKHSRSAFIFFCQEERAKLRKKNPDMSFGELSA